MQAASQERGRSLSLPRLGTEGLTKIAMKNVSTITLVFTASVLLFGAVPGTANGQTDCLACHADQSLQDAAGHSVAVDGPKFHTTIHGSLKCGDCHTTIKEYPHPDKATPVKCDTCHADEAAGLVEAYMQIAPSILAPVAMETPIPFFPRTIPARQSTR